VAQSSGPLNDDSIARACRTLARRDPDLGAIYRRHGAPPLWRRRPGFRTLVQIILEQQVSLASGRATLRRIEAAHGSASARVLAAAGERGLRSVGVTRQKARYCTLLAEASLCGDLDLGKVSRSSDEDAMGMLMAFTGVGRWTAEVYLLMALGRPDVWPAGDLALAKAVGAIKGTPGRPDEETMRSLAEPWRPFRAVAARLLWQDYLVRDRRG
jgi:DNA-3-methyladenine glycosylase II